MVTGAGKTARFERLSIVMDRIYKDSGPADTGNIHIFPGARQRRRRRGPLQTLAARQSARVRLTRGQALTAAGLGGALLAGFALAPGVAGLAVYALLWLLFAGNAALRLAAAAFSRTQVRLPFLPPALLPRYSVLVALYREAAIAPQVLDAMLALRYPRDRLEILFVLEADDAETIAAFRALHLPDHVRLVHVPPGLPRTKPRALNHALAQARSDLVVVYDAEDRPDSGQLLEAARVFAAGSPRLICLQAPLRPDGEGGFIARQFAAEYAVQFDIILPAMARFGLAFPLGGTSNHFKVSALKKLGGWDAFNVTEDADLGARLVAAGYESGLLQSPTREAATAASHAWLPQRTRWIKGYMQTLLVHMRGRPGGEAITGRGRYWAGLGLGVGMSVVAALAYAPLSVMMVASLLLFGLQAAGDPHHAALMPALANLGLFVFGNAAALATLAIGQRRAGLKARMTDLMAAPLYWCLQSVAAVFALHQLVARPFHWDKTEHAPDAEVNRSSPDPACWPLAAE